MPIATEPVARYFPLSLGHYAITPGFYRLGHDFGNGHADACLFQIDREFAAYRQAKQTARHEDPGKYICLDDTGRALEPAVNRFMLTRLSQEHPHRFQLKQAAGQQGLTCKPNGERLTFDQDGRYLGCKNEEGGAEYHGGLDALAMQVQEDLALIRIENGQNRLCAIHLCQPNHWDPREKIGVDFAGIHRPVPHMERINHRAAQLLQACLDQGPYVRFAWGIATDDRLNHHPVPPAGFKAVQWAGREFDPHNPAAWLRVERQVLYGLPAISAVLFTIRTYHYPLTELSRQQQALLQQAVAGMDQATLEYKGLAHIRQPLLDWLQALSAPS